MGIFIGILILMHTHRILRFLRVILGWQILCNLIENIYKEMKIEENKTCNSINLITGDQDLRAYYCQARSEILHEYFFYFYY